MCTLCRGFAIVWNFPHVHYSHYLMSFTVPCASIQVFDVKQTVKDHQTRKLYGIGCWQEKLVLYC